VKYKRVYVDPEFFKIMKIKASENDKTIVEYTKELAQKSDRLKSKPINDSFWRLL
jgi:hypothetical protein